jgi:hypothetical protein
MLILAVKYQISQMFFADSPGEQPVRMRMHQANRSGTTTARREPQTKKPLSDDKGFPDPARYLRFTYTSPA